MALRTLYLIRHGAFDREDLRPAAVGKGLVAKGRQQARWTGRWLARSGISFDRCHCSTLLRARETAAAMLKALSPLDVHHTRDLRECLYPTEHRSGRPGNPPHPLRNKSLQHILNAHRRFFRPARGKDKHELLVCHGNLIRCLVNVVLGLKPRAWIGMASHHCGITVVEVQPNGRQFLVAVNATGHLPPNLLSE